MVLTPEVLARAYALLRETDPFKDWHLPAAPRFEVYRHADRYADFSVTKGRHHYRVSSRNVGQLDTLLRVMAHEMIHAAMEVAGLGHLDHGPVFQALARDVCTYHNFDYCFLKD